MKTYLFVVLFFVLSACSNASTPTHNQPVPTATTVATAPQVTKIPSSSGTPVVIQLVPVTTDTHMQTVTPLPLIPVTVPSPPTLELHAGGFVALEGNIASSSPTVIVRIFPSESATNIGIILSGKAITIQARNLSGDWLLIFYAHEGGIVEGWVNRTVVENNSDLTQLPILIGGKNYSPANVPYNINAAGIYIRNVPIGIAPKGTPIRNQSILLLLWTQSKDHQFWYFCRTEAGIEGWCFLGQMTESLLEDQYEVPYLEIVR